MNLTEKTVSTRTVYDGKIIKVNVDKVLLPNGSTSFREEVIHGGGACVFAVVGGKIPLVKQFRYAYNKEIWEIPAGKLEKGEDPIVSAKRELSEETGLLSEDLKLIGTLYPSPGYTNEIIYVYFTENLKKERQRLDEGEFLQVEYFTVSELKNMALSGEICDSKTLYALFYYLSVIK